MTWGFTAVAVASTAASIYTGEKARKEQRKATRNQEGVRRAQQARERMAAVREQRIAQAQIVQGASTGGTLDSSSAQGGYSAVGSLTAGNIQFGNQMDFFQSRIAQNMTKANQYAGQSSMFNSLANLSMMASPNTTSTEGGGGSGTKNSVSTDQFISNVNAGGW
jgi:hypothetical protein